MNEYLQYTVIDGIKCFSPKVVHAYDDYPDSGFDLTDKNTEHSFWVNSRHRLFKRLVQCYLPSKGVANFLEIGCGTGNFIQQILELESIHITGSEVYLKGLKYAQKNIPNVDFIQLDISQGKINERFDLIVAFDVLEHIDDDNSSLENINQMLNQGGSVIISVPQHMFLWSKLDDIVKHKRRYSRQELLAKVKANGFEISYTTSFVFALFPLMLVSRLFDKGNNESKSEEEELEKRVQFSRGLNCFFDALMRIDETLIRFGVSLPFGGTLVVVASKNNA